MMRTTRRAKWTSAAVLAVVASAVACRSEPPEVVTVDDLDRQPPQEVTVDNPLGLLTLSSISTRKPVRIDLRVTDAATGRRIEGARVHLRGVARQVFIRSSWWREDPQEPPEPASVLVADSSGTVTIERDEPRQLEFVAEADGYVASEPKAPTIRLGRDDFEISLAPAAAVEGRVTDASSGAPVAGVRVAVWKPKSVWAGAERRDYGEAVSDANGSYLISTLPPGTRVFLQTTRDGYGPATLDFVAEAARRTTRGADLRLARPVTVAGTVRRGDGSPVGGAQVVVSARTIADFREFERKIPFPMSWTIDPCVEVKTSADGGFRAEGLAEGAKYTLHVVAEQPAAFSVSEFVAGAAPQDVVLTRFPRLFVRLIDRSGAPVTDAGEVTSWLDGQGAYRSSVDGSGWTQVAPELDGIGVGERHIRLDVRGYGQFYVNVDLKPGDELRTDAVIDRGEVLTGRVRDAAGRAVAVERLAAVPEFDAAEVGAWPSESLTQSIPLDAAGLFRFEGLAALPYRLELPESGRVVARVTPTREGLELTARAAPRVKLASRVVGDAPPGATAFVSAKFEGPPSRRVPIAPIAVRGAAEFALPEEGAWTLRLRVPGFVAVERKIDAAWGAVSDLGEIVFERGVALSGRVVAPDGRPVAAARVWVPDDDLAVAGAPLLRLTGGDGAFQVSGLAEGPTEFWVWADGFATHQTTVTASSGAAPLTVPLVPGRNLRARVVFRGGPVHDAALRVTPLDAPADADHVVTVRRVPAGSFALALPPGCYAAEASHPRLGRGRTEFTIPATAEIPLVTVSLMGN